MSNITNSIERKLDVWSENILLEEVCEKNKEIALKLFEVLKNKGNFSNSVNYKKFISLLNYEYENKLEVFLNQSDKKLIAKVYFDKYNGGRVGLVHGACSFSYLLLCIYILLEFYCQNDKREISLNHIKTKYKIKIPVNNIYIINAYTDGEEITAEMLNHESKVCVITNYSNKINKF